MWELAIINIGRATPELKAREPPSRHCSRRDMTRFLLPDAGPRVMLGRKRWTAQKYTKSLQHRAQQTTTAAVTNRADKT